MNENENQPLRSEKYNDSPAPSEVLDGEQAPSKAGKLRVWIIALIGAGIVAVAAAVFILLNGAQQQAPPSVAITPPPSGGAAIEETPDATPEPTNLPVVGYSPTTGRGVTDLNKEYWPMCVMIDNELPAIPQSGVGQADVVYEMYIEGGDTREMAVFNDFIPDKIGPIRSARIGFLEMLAEWKSLYVHVGGSPAKNDSNAFTRMSAMMSKGILPAHEDGNIPSSIIFRNPERKAPDNDYVDGQKLKEKYHERIPSPELRPFNFATDGNVKEGGADCKEIGIKYRGGFSVGYKYDETTATYARFRGDNPYVDANTGQQIMAANVILQQVSATLYDDKHVKFELIGSGKCYVIRNGKAIEGTWEKKDEASRTVFLDETGQEIDLKPGQTWIQMVNITRGGVPFTVVTLDDAPMVIPAQSPAVPAQPSQTP